MTVVFIPDQSFHSLLGLIIDFFVPKTSIDGLGSSEVLECLVRIFYKSYMTYMRSSIHGRRQKYLPYINIGLCLSKKENWSKPCFLNIRLKHKWILNSTHCLEMLPSFSFFLLAVLGLELGLAQVRRRYIINYFNYSVCPFLI